MSDAVPILLAYWRGDLTLQQARALIRQVSR